MSEKETTNQVKLSRRDFLSLHIRYQTCLLLDLFVAILAEIFVAVAISRTGTSSSVRQ